MWDIIAGGAHNHTFTLLLRSAPANTTMLWLWLTKGLLFYVNLSTSTPVPTLGFLGSAREPAWLTALGDADLTAVLAGHAARLVHPLCHESILLPALLQCSHVIPPDLYQILVLVGPTPSCELDAN